MPAVVQVEGVGRRELPRINGSSGAFVAVVVVLAVIIVVSCSAVVYLLQDARRRGNHPRQRYRSAGTASNRGGVDLGRTAGGDPGSTSGRLRSTMDLILSRKPKLPVTSPEPHPKPGKRSGQGWVQAAGNDDEESGDELKRSLGHAPQMSEVIENTSRPASATASASASPKAPLRVLDPRERVSSMLSDTSMSMDSTFRDGTALRYPEPYAPSPQRSISNITSHLLPGSMVSSPSSTPPPSINRLATSSPELMSGDDADDQVPDALRPYPNGPGGRSFASRSQSGISMRTMDTGSRFIEGL